MISDCEWLRGERRGRVGLLLLNFSPIESMVDITATTNYE